MEKHHVISCQNFNSGNDFRAFISTETGYGTAGVKDGKGFLEVKQGVIEAGGIVLG